MSESNPLHVILGAGQIAMLLANRLLAAGFRVRLVRRGPPAETRENLSWACGDLRDRGFAEEATRGAAVVYQCSAPPYEKWLDELAALWGGGLHGASRAGARYVVLDNMYLYGRVTSGPVDEDAPIRPVSRKGELRARLAEEITAAHVRGDVQATIGRATDFVGPGATIAIVFHEDFYRRARAGESAEVPGDPDQLHSF
jgi:nucleoside-diphosphate-sugar epimerase